MDNEASLLIQHFQIVAEILQSISILIGVGLTLGGLLQLKKHGESRTMMSSQHSLAGPLMMLVAGSMLMILPTFIGSALLAFWGGSNPLQHHTSSTSSSLVVAVEMFVRIVGVGAFIRGIVLLSRTGGQQSQQGTLGKALIHILGGILCVHIVGTVGLLKELLGMTTS